MDLNQEGSKPCSNWKMFQIRNLLIEAWHCYLLGFNRNVINFLVQLCEVWNKIFIFLLTCQDLCCSFWINSFFKMLSWQTLEICIFNFFKSFVDMGIIWMVQIIFWILLYPMVTLKFMHGYTLCKGFQASFLA